MFLNASEAGLVTRTFPFSGKTLVLDNGQQISLKYGYTWPQVRVGVSEVRVICVTVVNSHGHTNRIKVIKIYDAPCIELATCDSNHTSN